MIDVPVPTNDPIVFDAPFRPGMYEVRVSLAAADPGGPPVVRESNKLLLRIEPSRNIKYLLRSEQGRCIEETPGAGSDEIWWDAFVGQLVPHQRSMQR
jgi:hypothetical protein